MTNYKKEVNSGFDRKVIVEKIIEELLKEGVPAEFVRRDKYFIYPHEEMLFNLKRNFNTKELEVIDKYGRVGDDADEQLLGSNYFETARPVTELYPDKEDTIRLFKEIEAKRKKIEDLKNVDTTVYEKENQKLIKSLVKLETKYPILDQIKAYCEEYDNYFKENNSFPSAELTSSLLSKNGLTFKDCKKYSSIYNEYVDVEKALEKNQEKIQLALQHKTNNDEIVKLEDEIKEHQVEILKINTKLVNGFIRQRMGGLMVETDDLFQICYIALWEAIQNYDYSRGSLATYGYTLMETAVKRNFKSLTGIPWVEYWTKRSIEISLKEASELLGYKVTPEELVDLGLIGMSKQAVRNHMKIFDFYSSSDIFPVPETEDYSYNKDDDIKDDLAVDEEIEAFDSFEDVDPESVEREILKIIVSSKIDEVLSTLTEREQYIIIQRFGLHGNAPKTLEQVADMLGIHRERVRQIEQKALRKLRHPSRAKILDGYVTNGDVFGR